MAKLTEEELLFRKVEEKVKKAIFEYGLIVDGDRILIGLSGGKDSLALVDLLGRRSKIFLFPLFLDAAESLVRYCKEAWLQQDCPRASSGRYSRNPSDEHDPPGSDRNDAIAPKDG